MRMSTGTWGNGFGTGDPECNAAHRNQTVERGTLGHSGLETGNG